MNSTRGAHLTVQKAVATAFSGVCLGSGLSVRQTEAVDRYGEGCTDEEFAALPRQEVTEDWSAVSDGELERVAVAHLDAEGYRYYIPALALSVLRNYDPGSMRVIGTISSLYPRRDSWAYHMQQYSALSEPQKHALYIFLTQLPRLVELEHEDSKRVERAVRNYWLQFQHDA